MVQYILVRVTISFDLAPFLHWFKDYDRSKITRDLIAGLTVAAVLVPQGMAYALLAGMPPIYGLYASFLPTIVAALFGSSRFLATGPVAMTALLSASVIYGMAEPGSERGWCNGSCILWTGGSCCYSQTTCHSGWRQVEP
ncbi:SulP family inorganic anion transporter [Thermocrinis sp.]|uniref:SulP family inorganic anion transporter n=1 Tax=Thermocrinis sp. TaxID=2024383 RepID=UPI002FDDB3C1